MSGVVLLILDGFGWKKADKYNAVTLAKKKNFDALWVRYPHALLRASGDSVGLPKGQMGTSEANHLIIGSGRIVYQNLAKINRGIADDTLAKNPVLISAFNHANKNRGKTHIIGVVSPGGVHGHIEHLMYLAKVAKADGVENLVFHLFTDGRDTPPKSALKYVAKFENYLKKIGTGRVGTIGGRFFGMDRDNNTERIEKHFQTLLGNSEFKTRSAKEAIVNSYDKGITDEYIPPTIIGEAKDQGIQKGDTVIFSNFRSDRAKQLANRFRSEKIEDLAIVCATKYDDSLTFPVIFPPEKIENTLSEVLSRNSVKQLKVTETEKFTHLTFFFNAQKYKAEKLEKRVMIPTNKIETHDKKPEMRAEEIATAVISGIKDGSYGLICANIVNCDIVGHTGNIEATAKAVEAVDIAIGRIVKIAKEAGANVIITADHGNAEEMFSERDNQPLTSHTLNPVPFLLVSPKFKKLNRTRGLLSDIAPTILKMLGQEIPVEMTGKPLI